MIDDADLLALHRALVGIPSVSHDEAGICDWLGRWFASRGVEAMRMGNNLVAVTGSGPTLCLNSHLDTVPPSSAWTRPPHDVAVNEGRVYGLGSNDAKASVAAMISAFLRIRARGAAVPARVLLTLVCDEETGGQGTEVLLPELARREIAIDAAIIGEPTSLDIATAQKGLLSLELRGVGQACHAANARSLGAANAIRALALDLAALDGVDLGPDHPALGPVTLEPTVIAGGTARNMVPAEATCIVDVRTNPTPAPAELAARLRAVVVGGDLRVRSDRLRAREVARGETIVRAAQKARPSARLYGSRTLSDWVFFGNIPAIKCGPGDTKRSHGPDEFVLESEVLEGARFYEQAVIAFAAMAAESSHDATLGSG